MYWSETIRKDYFWTFKTKLCKTLFAVGRGLLLPSFFCIHSFVMKHELFFVLPYKRYVAFIYCILILIGRLSLMDITVCRIVPALNIYGILHHKEKSIRTVTTYRSNKQFLWHTKGNANKARICELCTWC
jgi:hypothetical protein